MMKKINVFLSIIIVLLCCAIVFLTLKKYQNNPSKIFENNVESIVEIKSSDNDNGDIYGSGIIYDKTGVLITNYHIISFKKMGETKICSTIQARFYNEKEYHNLSIVHFDENKDIAILKFINYDAKFIPIKQASARIGYGDRVYAIGNTNNNGIGISEGIISVPCVNFISEGTELKYIQCDINVSNGNSGGALVDRNGELIGMTTFRTRDNFGTINYGYVYCIPLEVIKEFILSYSWK